MSEDIAEMTHGADKRVALLIAILALLLFFSEAGGKSAQHHSTEANIKSSDTWAMYQAKRIRSTQLDSSAKSLDLTIATVTDSAAQAAIKKQSDTWKATVERYENEPKDGLKDLAKTAEELAHERDLYNVKFEHYELASGLLQLAIVIASASIITGIAALVWLSGALGVGGAALLVLGSFAPNVLTFLGSH